MNESGAMQTSWVFVGSAWYFLDGSGAMRTGWHKVGGDWYYLDKSGALLTNTKTPDGYYVNENGEWV